MTAAFGLTLLLAARPAQGQCCGDCNEDGEVRINELITAVNEALSGCGGSVTPSGCPLLQTGQVASFQPDDDGDVRAGARLRYRDNGDGTITDLNTGLMWEKKGGGQGCLNCEGDRYAWSAAFTDWLARLNGEVGHCALRDEVECRRDADCPPTPDPFPPDFCVFPEPFAGYDDWRMPNVRELQSLVDYGKTSPAVDAVFQSDCRGNYSPVVCSCTRTSPGYWASTSLRAGAAWSVGFENGSVTAGSKGGARSVRAVRAGTPGL